MIKLQIPYSEFEFSFVRSSGPGGQNVNKVNSKAVLRWNLLKSQSLDEETRARLLQKLATKLTTEFELILTSDVYRDQQRNREECITKFYAMIQAALIIPKKRKKSKPSWTSRVKAKESKKKHSEKKRNRRGFE